MSGEADIPVRAIQSGMEVELSKQLIRFFTELREMVVTNSSTTNTADLKTLRYLTY